jgi:hypothetical protein
MGADTVCSAFQLKRTAEKRIFLREFVGMGEEGKTKTERSEEKSFAERREYSLSKRNYFPSIFLPSLI